jgi:Enoyl-(Acyl carrier protein) reductase
MGIVGLTYSCANALGRLGATANAISPTADTRMMDSIPADRRKEAGSPDDIGPAVGWLASSASSWCNGQVLAVQQNSITLYSAPGPSVRIVARGRWSEEIISAAAETAFAQVAKRQSGWPITDRAVKVIEV